MRALGPGLFLSLFLLHVIPIDAAVSAPDEGPERPDPAIVEHVEVTVDRIGAGHQRVERTPAHVTVLDRTRIKASGAVTLQDLLGLEAGAVVYDQVGNFVEKRFDLRGFTAGNATKVYLDGAPVNDSRNNALALWLMPVEGLERVEIVRGSAANSAGGGAEAGVVHLTSRTDAPFGGVVSLAAGSDASRRAVGTIQDRTGDFDWRLSAFGDRSDGFRENAGGDLERFSATLGYRPSEAGRLELVLVASASDLGQPGALTPAELEADPSASPYNSLDSGDESLRQATLGWRGSFGAGWSLAANGFARARESEILSTGRAAPVFGGFFLDSDASELGATIQAARSHGGARGRGELSFGVEWLDGSTDALGYFTPPTDPGAVDRSSPASDNRTDRTVAGLFIQERFSPANAWDLVAAVRWDRDRVAYDERIPDPSAGDATNFDEITLRAGVSYRPADRHGLWLSYGESFLPPTAEQLFAFPLFGSNPDLVPQTSRTVEFGWRLRVTARQELTVAILQVDTQDEIVFVPGGPPDFIGFNENAGRTRRRGVETSWSGRLREGIETFANLTWLDAEFRSGATAGNDVPLVPSVRAAAGLRAALGTHWSLRAQALHVGSQPLDGDPANDQPPLDAYTVVDTRITWSAGPEAGLALWVEATNLFDEGYATRGIWAFDFSAGQSSVFLTPAPGRRWLAGADWRF